MNPLEKTDSLRRKKKTREKEEGEKVPRGKASLGIRGKEFPLYTGGWLSHQWHLLFMLLLFSVYAVGCLSFSGVIRGLCPLIVIYIYFVL